MASPKLFAFMNDKTAKKQNMQIEDNEVKARLIEINSKEIPVVKLGEIADVKKGIDTGENKYFLFQNPQARGNYKSIDDYRDFLLSEQDLEKIRNDEK